MTRLWLLALTAAGWELASPLQMAILRPREGEIFPHAADSTKGPVEILVELDEHVPSSFVVELRVYNDRIAYLCPLPTPNLGDCPTSARSDKIVGVRIVLESGHHRVTSRAVAPDGQVLLESHVWFQVAMPNYSGTYEYLSAEQRAAIDGATPEAVLALPSTAESRAFLGGVYRLAWQHVAHGDYLSAERVLRMLVRLPVDTTRGATDSAQPHLAGATQCYECREGGRGSHGECTTRGIVRALAMYLHRRSAAEAHVCSRLLQGRQPLALEDGTFVQPSEVSVNAKRRKWNIYAIDMHGGPILDIAHTLRTVLKNDVHVIEMFVNPG
jgi:hypothetical protein